VDDDTDNMESDFYSITKEESDSALAAIKTDKEEIKKLKEEQKQKKDKMRSNIPGIGSRTSGKISQTKSITRNPSSKSLKPANFTPSSGQKMVDELFG